MPGCGNQGAGNQNALIRALVALTNEVRALRSEVAAMRASHAAKPAAGAKAPVRRMAIRSMGLGAPGKGGAAGRAFILEKPKSQDQGEHKPHPAPSFGVVSGKSGHPVVGTMVMPKAGGVVRMPAPQKNADLEKDMAKLRAEMAEIRGALKKLMMEMKKLQTGK
jgi:hypothetical protein